MDGSIKVKYRNRIIIAMTCAISCCRNIFYWKLYVVCDQCPMTAVFKLVLSRILLLPRSYKSAVDIVNCVMSIG